jgi:hypothetical protein
VNPGNLIGLTILLGFTGCGSWAGYAMAGNRGAFAGAIAGALVWFGLAVKSVRNLVPPCVCGDTSNATYEVLKPEPRLTRFRCQSCGRTYQIHRGLWSALGDDGTLVPMMRRRRGGAWMPIS